MTVQDKRAEISLSNKYLEDGSWDDSDTDLKDRQKKLELLQPILSSQDGLILDAGCGPGNYGIMLARKNEVVGIDISFKMASTAKERAEKGKAGFRPLVADLERLPFKNSSFDICFCGYTLHHFPDICTALGELVRVTKPEGKIVLLEPNGSNPGVRLSNILENLISRQLVKHGLDTPNETIHNHKCYVKALEQQGVTDIQITPHYFGGLPPLPCKSQKASFGLSMIRFVVHLRRLLYIFLAKALPRPFNGAELLITGTKKDPMASS
jgi:ubiquinone/menaquinone biosynthesis C-methylase UbiE